MKEYVVRIWLGKFKKIKTFGVGVGFPSEEAEWAEVVSMAHRHARELLEILKSHGLEGLPDGDIKIERIG
jgi:hypothetical protein